jgi:hypothetical protein
MADDKKKIKVIKKNTEEGKKKYAERLKRLKFLHDHGLRNDPKKSN